MHGNYTVTSTSIEAAVGAQVNLTTPTVTLTIAANDGYTVTHTDFTIGDALPSEVTSAVFSQNGVVVDCLLTLDNSFIMPAADVNLAIDIDGAAVGTQYSVAGTYDIKSTNTNIPPSAGNVYSGSGGYGETVTLFTLAFTADTNGTFPTGVASLVSINNAFPDRYEITQEDTYSGPDLVGATFTVKYTFGDDLTVVGDKLKFIAFADIGLVETEFYYNYVFKNVGNPDSSGEYNLDRSASTPVLRVFGDPGARITINVANELGNSDVHTLEVISSNGSIELPIVLIEAAADRTTTITLSGDISPGFVQPNPILIHQTAGVAVTLEVTPLAGYSIVEKTGPYVYSGQSGFVEPANQLTSEIVATFIIKADDNSTIKFLRAPNWGDIFNIDPVSNGGTAFDISAGLTYSGDGTSTARINVASRITTFGSSDLDIFLDISGLFNVNPIAIDDAASVTKGGTVVIPVIDNDISTRDLSPIIKTSAAHGFVTLSGDFPGQIQYTHDGSTNYKDLFTYVANDGFINSNIAVVNINVGIEAGDSLQLSSTNGIFYVPVVVGSDSGTFTMHFDSGTIPDRVEILYEGNIVADSLFIGDDLTDGNRAAAVALIEGVTTLNSYDYVGAGGDGTSYGQTAAWNIKVEDNAVSYSDPIDIAPTGNVRGGTSNYGGQIGVGDLVYTSPSDVIGATGLDSADGNASISYNKAPGGETFVILKITGIESTGWSIYQTSMV